MKRTRLLLRVFQAYWNSLGKVGTAKSSDSKEDEEEFNEQNTFLTIPSVTSSLNSKISDVNQSDVLSAMSVEMCLTLAKSLGLQSKILPTSYISCSYYTIIIIRSSIIYCYGGITSSYYGSFRSIVLI